MALVQAVAADNGGGATTVVINIAATTAGNTLIVGAHMDGSQTATVTDNKSGGSQTYTQRSSIVASGGQGSALFVCDNTAAGVTQIIIHLSSSVDAEGFVAEESGLVSTGSFDASASFLTSSSTSFSSTNATSTQAGDVAYGMATDGGVDNYAPGTGWTGLTGTGFSSGLHTDTVSSIQFLAVRQVVGAAGAYAFTGTTPIAHNVGAQILLLKAASSTSPISGTASITFGDSATLAGSGALAGSVAATFGQTGALAGAGALAGTLSVVFGESGALLGSGALQGSTAMIFGAQATPFGTAPTYTRSARRGFYLLSQLRAWRDQ